ncbi:GlcG/HbpS family heme-binding protein [Pseudocitrobacter cyperus]|uniref:Heme-binding protein n=1 Tax=Pseudocitrobacter cyperus TaxID=3112843 RepID=A0ABV0HFM5_9ENTR
MKRLFLSLFVASGMFSVASAATGVVSQQNLTLALAGKLADSAITACSAEKYNVAVTVVDRAGTPLVMKKMDNAGPHTPEASRMKAWTAITTKNSSEAVMKAAQANAGAANMGDIPGLLLLAGGVPLKVGDEVVGAIGIGGAPGGHLDQACALEAIKAHQSELGG